jgi:hypothetical protein
MLRRDIGNLFSIILLWLSWYPTTLAFSSGWVPCRSNHLCQLSTNPLNTKTRNRAPISLYDTAEKKISSPSSPADDDDDDNPEEETEKKTDRGRSTRPLVRLIDNIWYVMTAPFPDLRKLSRKRSENSDSKFVISLRLSDGIAALIVYLGVGVLSYHWLFEKWSIIDALYFTCVCFSTVG